MSNPPGRVEVEASCFSLLSLTCSDEALIESTRELLIYLKFLFDERNGDLTASVKSIAREHSSTVHSILKACSTWMDANQGNDTINESTKRSRAAVSEVACSTLEAIDFLRPALKATPAELNAQRYSLIRKMLGMASHHQALKASLALRQQLATDPAKDEMKSAITVSILSCLLFDMDETIILVLLPDLQYLVNSGSKHSQSILAFSSKVTAHQHSCHHQQIL